MINPSAPFNIVTANTPQELIGQPFKWFRLLTQPTGAVVSITTKQDQQVSPFFIVNPGDWLELKDPSTASRVQSTVAGAITFQWSLDDVIRSSPESSALTAAPANVLFGPFLGSGAYTGLNPPSGANTMRICIVGPLTGIQTVTVRDTTNGGGRFLPLRDAIGAGYQRLCAFNTSGSNQTEFYVDVAGVDFLNIYISTGVTVYGEFSVAKLTNPMKSMSYYNLDLGVNAGVDTFNGSWTASPTLECAGAKAISWRMEGTSNGASYQSVALGPQQPDLSYLTGYGDNGGTGPTIGASGAFVWQIMETVERNSFYAFGGAGASSGTGTFTPGTVLPGEAFQVQGAYHTGTAPTITAMQVTLLY